MIAWPSHEVEILSYTIYVTHLPNNRKGYPSRGPL